MPRYVEHTRFGLGEVRAQGDTLEVFFFRDGAVKRLVASAPMRALVPARARGTTADGGARRGTCEACGERASVTEHSRRDGSPLLLLCTAGHARARAPSSPPTPAPVRGPDDDVPPDLLDTRRVVAGCYGMGKRR